MTGEHAPRSKIKAPAKSQVADDGSTQFWASSAGAGAGWAKLPPLLRLRLSVDHECTVLVPDTEAERARTA